MSETLRTFIAIQLDQRIKEEIVKMTLAVIVIVVIAAIILSIADYAFLNLYDGVLYNIFTKLFA